MEILENIDLNKLIDELRLRDRKLKQLTGLDKEVKSKVEAVYQLGDQRVKEMQAKYTREKKMKEKAFQRLDALRLEIRAIEGQEITEDIWKDKCKELFALCKELQTENENLRAAMQTSSENHMMERPPHASLSDGPDPGSGPQSEAYAGSQQP